MRDPPPSPGPPLESRRNFLLRLAAASVYAPPLLTTLPAPALAQGPPGGTGSTGSTGPPGGGTLSPTGQTILVAPASAPAARTSGSEPAAASTPPWTRSGPGVVPPGPVLPTPGKPGG